VPVSPSGAHGRFDDRHGRDKRFLAAERWFPALPNGMHELKGMSNEWRLYEVGPSRSIRAGLVCSESVPNGFPFSSGAYCDLDPVDSRSSSDEASLASLAAAVRSARTRPGSGLRLEELPIIHSSILARSSTSSSASCNSMSFRRMSEGTGPISLPSGWFAT